MSTRATYEFRDKYGSYTVYVIFDLGHHNGYSKINNAIPYAWPLPRWEADDFGAAFIAGNKEKGGGGVYCTENQMDKPTEKDYDTLKCSQYGHDDTKFHYVITFQMIYNEIYVERWERNEEDDWKIAEVGPLNRMLQKYRIN